MGDIHILPGIERRDLCGEGLSSDAVMSGALEKGVIDAIVIGRDRSGSFYVASAVPDIDRCVGMLMRAVTFLSTAQASDGIVESDNAG